MVARCVPNSSYGGAPLRLALSIASSSAGCLIPEDVGCEPPICAGRLNPPKDPHSRVSVSRPASLDSSNPRARSMSAALVKHEAHPPVTGRKHRRCECAGWHYASSWADLFSSMFSSRCTRDILALASSSRWRTFRPGKVPSPRLTCGLGRLAGQSSPRDIETRRKRQHRSGERDRPIARAFSRAGNSSIASWVARERFQGRGGARHRRISRGGRAAGRNDIAVVVLTRLDADIRAEFPPVRQTVFVALTTLPTRRSAEPPDRPSSSRPTFCWCSFCRFICGTELIRNQKIAIMPMIGRKLIHAGGACCSAAAARSRMSCDKARRIFPELICRAGAPPFKCGAPSQQCKTGAIALGKNDASQPHHFFPKPACPAPEPAPYKRRSPLDTGRSAAW